MQRQDASLSTFPIAAEVAPRFAQSDLRSICVRWWSEVLDAEGHRRAAEVPSCGSSHDAAADEKPGFAACSHLPGDVLSTSRRCAKSGDGLARTPIMYSGA